MAGNDEARVLRTTVSQVDARGRVARSGAPAEDDTSPRAESARRLDATLREAAQDLGLTLDVSGRSDESEGGNDAELVGAARSHWVISARLEVRGSRLWLRVLAVAPGSKVVMSRSDEVEGEELDVRAMVMLRDLVQLGRGAPAEAPAPEVRRGAQSAVEARSNGRAVLALNSALLGAYVGLSIQGASSSGGEDNRLVYPLVALGTGVGLGASMIVADEWDVGLGDAWFISAGIWWPTASGLFLARGYDVDPASDRYVYGLAGATAGVTLATVALTFRGMGEGGAALAHSGGAMGTLLGGMTELAFEGRTDLTPSRGMGYGAGLGVLGAGLLATQIETDSSRVLLVDLGASLGALSGAATASPLVFDNPSAGANRAFVASVAAGTLVGGGLAYWVTHPAKSAARAPRSRGHVPHAVRRAARPSGPTWFPTAGPTAGAPGAAPGFSVGAVGTW